MSKHLRNDNINDDTIDNKLPRLSSPIAMTMRICICIRGDITHRIYETWATNLHKLFAPAVEVKITADYDDSAEIFVVYAACKENAFVKWSKGVMPSSLRGSLLTPQWIIDSLKAQKLLRRDEYRHKLIDQSLANFDNNVTRSPQSDNVKQSQIVRETTVTIEGNSSAALGQSPDDAIEKKAIDPRMQHYACVKSGTSMMPPNQNKELTDILDQLQHTYELMGDEWRSQGYKKAISQLKLQPKITSIEQVQNLRHVGKKIRERIMEYLQTGTVQKLDSLNSIARFPAITEMANIWGVGPKTAEKWFKMGFNSVADLRDRGVHLLSRVQAIGLKHFDEFLIKIPRNEVSEIGKVVMNNCYSFAPNAECCICGSYRRGKSECGDVDILIVPPRGTEFLPPMTLSRLIYKLEQIGFLTDHLGLPSNYEQHLEIIKSHYDGASNTFLDIEKEQQDHLLQEMRRSGIDYLSDEEDMEEFYRSTLEEVDSHGGSRKIKHQFESRYQRRNSYMGVCRLPSATDKPNLHRRIDIKVYPRSLMGFAQLYFTGSDHFNRSMRNYAGKKGFTLHDKGLFRVMRDERNAIIRTSEISTACADERDIFDALGLPFKEPWERNVFDEYQIHGNNEDSISPPN